MDKTVVGLFDTFATAQQVVQRLLDQGFPRGNVSLIANESDISHANEVAADANATRSSGQGAVGGSLVGGALGLLVGVGVFAIPGIGPVLAIGPLAAALGSTALGAGIGAATGGLIGALTGAGVPAEEADYYSEGVRRGGTLVVVITADDQAALAYTVMQEAGAVDLKTRSEGWRQSGWQHFDPDAEPYRSGDPSNWEKSSKLGTVSGSFTGAAAGAVIGAIAGPPGAIIGAAAGAAVGGGVGAAADSAGAVADDMDQRWATPEAYTSSPREKWTEDPHLFEAHEADFRQHHHAYFSQSGRAYEDYVAIYRYGYQLGLDPRYKQNEWTEIEPLARQHWEEEQKPQPWNQISDIVEYAWQKARGHTA